MQIDGFDHGFSARAGFYTLPATHLPLADCHPHGEDAMRQEGASFSCATLQSEKLL